MEKEYIVNNCASCHGAEQEGKHKLSIFAAYW